MLKHITETTEYLVNKGFDNPEIGIVLGTGLGKLIDEIEVIAEAHYNNIPHFPLATVEFHTGKLVYGILAGKKVIVMQGRFHLYEGYDFIDITYPIRIMHKLGIKKLLVSNAAGAINLDYKNIHILYEPISIDRFQLEAYLKKSIAKDPLKFKKIDFIIISKKDVYFNKQNNNKLKKSLNIIQNFNNAGNLGYENFKENKYFYIWKKIK